jgi:hypothetical protein
LFFNRKRRKGNVDLFVLSRRYLNRDKYGVLSPEDPETGLSMFADPDERNALLLPGLKKSTGGERAVQKNRALQARFVHSICKDHRKTGTCSLQKKGW